MKFIFYACLIVLLITCKGTGEEIEAPVTVLDILKSEKRIRSINKRDLPLEYIYQPIQFDSLRLADRFLFFPNGYIKEYDFINNEKATYKIKFDETTKLLSIEGNPIVYIGVNLNKKKDSVYFKGIISSYLLNKFNLVVNDKILKKEIPITDLVESADSRILHFFTYAAQLKKDSIYVLFNLETSSNYLGDKLFSDTASFIVK